MAHLQILGIDESVELGTDANVAVQGDDGGLVGPKRGYHQGKLDRVVVVDVQVTQEESRDRWIESCNLKIEENF